MMVFACLCVCVCWALCCSCFCCVIWWLGIVVVCAHLNLCFDVIVVVLNLCCVSHKASAGGD